MTLQEKTYREIALTVAHTKYKDALARYAQFKLRNRALADDLVQDAFAKTWTYLAKGGKIVAMKAFLYRVLNNLIIDEYRKHKTASLDAMIDGGFEPDMDTAEAPLSATDSEKAVVEMNKLPAKYQKVVKMRYFDELTLEEIAKKTGQSKNSIAVQVHRGVRKIRSYYDRHAAAGMLSEIHA